MTYVQEVIARTIENAPEQEEFHQAVREILPSLEAVMAKRPRYRRMAILERLVEPDRTVVFRIPWEADDGTIQVNRGYRVQYNNALGPYKGGLRFHPSVNLSIMKFLAFEQIFKNSLTTLPLGGAKGGANFDPKGRSEQEIMRFCQSFANELSYLIGADLDVPAGDIGVGTREIGFILGQYKKIRRGYPVNAITGKDIESGGSELRPQATGFGIIFFLRELLADHGMELRDQRVIISGSGNVALATCEKARELGARVIAMSDSRGYIVDEEGIDIVELRRIKEVERASVEKYLEKYPRAKYHSGSEGIWDLPVDIAIPCATQNEIGDKQAKKLIANGVKAVCEGANMPSTMEAIDRFFSEGILFAPAKAANAGGVATSGLEMSQNSMRYNWTYSEVEDRLQKIMKDIYTNCKAACTEYNCEKGLLDGANIAGFLKVGDAMLAQGV